eukprot:4761192-Amphidinium_carterae.1
MSMQLWKFLVSCSEQSRHQSSWNFERNGEYKLAWQTATKNKTAKRRHGYPCSRLLCSSGMHSTGLHAPSSSRHGGAVVD